jgi:L-lactate dehydrogenase complex protein LldG
MSTDAPARHDASGAGPSARDEILAGVRAALPPGVERPPAVETLASVLTAGSLAETFIAAATAAGAEVTSCDRAAARVALSSLTAGARSAFTFASAPSAAPGPSDPHELADLDLVVCEPALGVAENGAVWLATSDSMARAALLLAQRVVVVVAERDLVRDLHEAYARIDVRAHPFGAFVAGPSKTADIEQALVIGAHGPKAFTILLVHDHQTGEPS